MNESCAWTEDEDGIYHSDCGEAFEFTVPDGGPKAHGWKFCCYCGKPVKGVLYEEPDLELFE